MSLGFLPGIVPRTSLPLAANAEQLEHHRHRCECVLVALAEAAQHCLPPGWLVVPFGSHVQDTALPNSILDVAVVFAGEDPSPGAAVHDRTAISLAGDLALSFATFLTTETPYFRHGTIDESGRHCDASTELPAKLACGNIASGRYVHLQDVTLYPGDMLTGHVDSLLCQLLNIDSRARAHVRAVKRWASEQGFATACPFPIISGVASEQRQGIVRDSLFTWTLLAVFGLQQQRFLPPIRFVASPTDAANWVHFGGAPLRSLTAQEPDDLMRCFLEQMLAYAGLPEPRPLMSVWDGAFVPWSSSSRGARRNQPVIRPSSVGKVLEALRSLRAELETPPPVPPLPSWLRTQAPMPIAAAPVCAAPATPHQRRAAQNSPSITIGSSAPFSIQSMLAVPPMFPCLVAPAPAPIAATRPPASAPFALGKAAPVAKQTSNQSLQKQSLQKSKGARSLQALATISEAPEQDDQEEAVSANMSDSADAIQTSSSSSLSTSSSSDDSSSLAVFARSVPLFPFEAGAVPKQAVSFPPSKQVAPPAPTRRRRLKRQTRTATTQALVSSSSSQAAIVGAAAAVGVDSSSPSSSRASAQHSSRWNVSSSFIATRSCSGGGAVKVQLDPCHVLNEGLGPADWERRFNRREHQIRLAKSTTEYKVWQAHVDINGCGPGDPQTPRVAVQTSKKEFETEYNQWRLKLHVKPPSVPF